jgi:hypothetical protein
MILSREYENPDTDPDPNGPEYCATADTMKMCFCSLFLKLWPIHIARDSHFKFTKFHILLYRRNLAIRRHLDLDLLKCE